MIFDEADQEDRDMKDKLYQLFFKWRQESEDMQDINRDDSKLMTEEDKLEKDKVDLAEEKKLEKLAKEQALIEFKERGGFSQVLKDIFNPADMAAMELDSVFQLKSLCKNFYRKKQLMS